MGQTTDHGVICTTYHRPVPLLLRPPLPPKMSLLSRALRSQSSSLTNLQNLSTSGHSLSELASEATQLDDSVHSISFDINDREEQPHHSHSNEEEDELLFNVEEAGQEMPVRTALCGASLTQRR